MEQTLAKYAAKIEKLKNALWNYQSYSRNLQTQLSELRVCNFYVFFLFFPFLLFWFFFALCFVYYALFWLFLCVCTFSLELHIKRKQKTKVNLKTKDTCIKKNNLKQPNP